MCGRRWLTTIAALAVSATCTADTWDKPQFRVEGVTAFLSGTVAHEQLASLRAASADLSTVVLNSAGGDAVVAISMAREIRRRGLTTYVGRHSQCVSACTLIFQGGAVRAVHPSAFLAYHTPKVVGPDGPSERVLARTRANFRALYLELGMPESTVREFWHSHVMMFYSAHELLRRNIATVITDLDLKSPDCAFSC